MNDFTLGLIGMVICGLVAGIAHQQKNADDEKDRLKAKMAQMRWAACMASDLVKNHCSKDDDETRQVLDLIDEALKPIEDREE